MPRGVNITDMLAAEVENGDKEAVGGINIAEQIEYLKNEQEYDKKLYKERIKRIHRVRKPNDIYP